MLRDEARWTVRLAALITSMIAATTLVLVGSSVSVAEPVPTGQAIPEPGVGQWLMDDGSGSIIADSSGTGNRGTVIGSPSWVEGVRGGALRLRGSQYVRVANHPSVNPTTALTVAAWVRPDQVGTQYIMRKGVQGTTDGFELSLSSASAGQVAFFRLNQASSANRFRVDSTTRYPANGRTWVHLAGTYDGSRIRLYVDGVEQASAPGPTRISQNSLPLAIGAQSDGTSHFGGALDEVNLYARALSAAQVKALASSTPVAVEPAPVESTPAVPPSAVGRVFPDESTTGVPDGVVLKSSGSLRITKNGTVINGLEVRGTITVQADDVIIRNTRVINTGSFAIRNDGGRNLLVEDSEIDGQGRGDAAVAFSRYTLRRVHIYNVAEGPRIAGSDVTIEDSYIHQLVQRPGDHTDAVQMVSGKNALIRGNRIDSYNPAAGSLGNAAFMFGEDMGKVTNCRVEGNYFNGGNYTINGGGAGTKGAACTFRDNTLGRNHRYGPIANLGPKVLWDSTNTWADTGTPVRSE